MVRFIILMQWGRVGSNLVVNFVRQSKIASLVNERFNTVRDLDEQLRFYVQHYQLDAAAPTHRLIGMKENILSLADPALFVRRFREDGLRIVRMRRDNLVKAAISQMRGELFAEKSRMETGEARWAVRKGEEPLGPTRIDPDTLLTRIGMMERARATLMEALPADEVLDIEYGDLLADMAGVVSSLRSYLEIPDDGQYRVPFVKATPDALDTIILNADEVKAALAGTRYAAMLGRTPASGLAGAE